MEKSDGLFFPFWIFKNWSIFYFIFSDEALAGPQENGFHDMKTWSPHSPYFNEKITGFWLANTKQ